MPAKTIVMQDASSGGNADFVTLDNLRKEVYDCLGKSTVRFAKPLDVDLIRRLLSTHEVAVTIEEGAVGGFGAHVLTLASDDALIDGGLKLRTMRLPDVFQDHDKPERQYAEAGLDADAIVKTVLTALRHNSVGIAQDTRLGA